MKKKAILNFVVLVISIGCYGQRAPSIKKKMRDQVINPQKFWIYNASSIVIPSLYQGSTPIQTAANNVARYRNISSTQKAPQSYTINTTDLLDYITKAQAQTTIPSNVIEFLLGQNSSNQFFMYVSVVDINGEHFYYRLNTGTCNILGSPIAACTQCPNFNNRLNIDNPPLPLSANQTINNFYPGAMSAANAASLVTMYGTDPNKNSTVSTWLYNLNDFKDYLTRAKTAGSKCVQFLLGEAAYGSTLQVIIVNVDNESDQYFFQYNNHPCVLENCNPCPTCEVAGLEAVCE